MTRQLLSCILSAAVAASASALFAAGNTSAQPATRPSASLSPEDISNTPAHTSAGSPVIQGGNIDNAPNPSSSSNGGIVIRMNGASTVNGQTQVDGRLVDIQSLASGRIPLTGPNSIDSGGSAAAAGLAPNNIEHNTGTGAVNGRGNGMSGSIGTLVPLKAAETNGNNSGTSVGIAPGGTNSSFGTYDHPGATAGVGTAGLQSGVVGQGISPTGPIAMRQGMTPADDATGTGTASREGGGSGQPNTHLAGQNPNPANTPISPAPAPAAAPISDATIQQNLAKGVPAAVLTNGRAYQLACDPKQLAPYAGQTVRVTGTLAANQSLSPTSLEVQSPSGSYQPVALTPNNNNKNNNTANNNTNNTNTNTPRTANER